jgi:hypothetical protein
MLNTKDMKSGGGRIKPVIEVGNQVIKINSITFDQTPYDKEAYNILLHVESEPVTGNFQGFLVDVNKPNGKRFKGQVGRVRMSPYAYKDATLPSGREISRDNEVLKAMIFLAETLGKRDELDVIEAKDIFEFMKMAGKILSKSDYINACIAGREWENREGYVNYDLFLPRLSKDGVPLEALDKEPSRLLTFNRADHVKELKKNKTQDTFEPANKNSFGDDFDL